MADNAESKPDFRKGFPFRDLPGGTPVAGRVEDDDLILVRQGEDFVRIATSLKKEDGSRAIGTTLGRDHPAFAAIVKFRDEHPQFP